MALNKHLVLGSVSVTQPLLWDDFVKAIMIIVCLFDILIVALLFCNFMLKILLLVAMMLLA